MKPQAVMGLTAYILAYYSIRCFTGKTAIPGTEFGKHCDPQYLSGEKEHH